MHFSAQNLICFVGDEVSKVSKMEYYREASSIYPISELSGCAKLALVFLTA
jgi:hypothetical protein